MSFPSNRIRSSSIEPAARFSFATIKVTPSVIRFRASPTFSDACKVATVTFTKLGDGAAPLSGAVFTLCDANGEPVQGFPTQSSGADGKVTFSGVPYGDYLANETNAPIGYHPLTIGVSLHDSNAAIVTEETSHAIDLGDRQDAASGSLTLTKFSAEYADGATAAMSGIMFQVLNSDGQ